MARVTLEGGGFQDESGLPLANGYLTMQPSQEMIDTENTVSYVVVQLTVRIRLDENANVAGAPQVYANDTASPSGTYYNVMLYSSNGTAMWRAPQKFTILSTVNPLNIGTWVPVL